MKRQSGFTLIELIMVIVILGILAATALPKFVDLKADAEASAIKGVAGAVNSAFAVNYAANAVNSAKGASITGAVMSIAAAVNNVMIGGLPAGYSVSATDALVTCGTAGVTNAITISSAFASPNSSTTATLICTG